MLGPNITGTNGTNWVSSGAFYSAGKRNSFPSSEQGGNNISFDASLVSSIYREIETIQPSSSYALMIIRA